MFSIDSAQLTAICGAGGGLIAGIAALFGVFGKRKSDLASSLNDQIRTLQEGYLGRIRELTEYIARQDEKIERLEARNADLEARLAKFQSNQGFGQ
ncbi:hypothetical protein [Methylovirgula sp. 4M-Z18]|uniref:hypothetical protein n=1 Tax=Methylovirgula sp. 4M-Z18 TaxID=2293567 RepID=UPI000E2F420F|nr:hypothetical protein [Methylovirgula sp. 4M-Z18]RFB80382.1 hypothetical protein DYH55_02320 [Methylovirgula sp. 4M-Z18]